MGFYGKYRTKRAYRKAVTNSTKGVRSAVGSAVKKRYWNKGINMAQISKDLAMVKGMLNVEKKRFETNAADYPIAQISNNGGSYQAIEITPTPSQGTGYGSREGASILFKSFYAQLQFQSQSSLSQKMRIKIQIVQTRTGDAFDMAKFSNWNQFIYAANTTAIYDTACSRNQDYFADFKVLATKWVTLPGDTVTSQTVQKNALIKLKFKRGHHVRFYGNTNTVTNNRFYMVITADNGNSGGTNSSLAKVAITAANTGATMDYNAVAYYIDN